CRICRTSAAAASVGARWGASYVSMTTRVSRRSLLLPGAVARWPAARITLRHGAMDPAGKVRCNMWKQIELGRGDCNQVAAFVSWSRSRRRQRRWPRLDWGWALHPPPKEQGGPKKEDGGVIGEGQQ